MGQKYEPPAGVKWSDSAVTGRHGPIPIRRYHRDGLEDRGRLVWLHGGAFTSGGLDQLESHAVAAELASHGLEVIAVDYRLVPPLDPSSPQPPFSPGHRYPVPLDDVVDVVKTVSVEGSIALGGASAGACLAAAAVLQLRDTRAAAIPTRLILVYGTFHAALPPASPGLCSRVSGPHAVDQFTSESTGMMNDNYVGGDSRAAGKYAFPGDAADLSQFPPTLVLDADRDTLRASSSAFARQLRQAGAAVAEVQVPNSRHGFLDRPEEPFFAEGIDVLAAEL